MFITDGKLDQMAYVSLWNWLNASLIKTVDQQDTVTTDKTEFKLRISKFVKDIHVFSTSGTERNCFISESVFTLRI